MLTDKSGIARFFGKPVELFFREVRFLVAAERYVELAAQVIAAQAVIAVAVQVQEQQRPAVGSVLVLNSSRSR